MTDGAGRLNQAEGVCPVGEPSLACGRCCIPVLISVDRSGDRGCGYTTSLSVAPGLCARVSGSQCPLGSSGGHGSEFGCASGVVEVAPAFIISRVGPCSDSSSCAASVKVVALCGEQVHRVEFVRRDHFTQDAVIGVADAGKGKAETGLAGTDGGVQFLGEDVESDLPAAHVLAQQQSFGDSLGAALDDFS
ncbi:hypothetical protein [Rhodococcus koreensis]|uniref:hypothetical protein n=1 Tax=Rhodococcus koreensis TaxID=99653 RepID=UPI00366D3900